MITAEEKEDIKWSAVAARAFEDFIASVNRRKGQKGILAMIDLDAAVRRLSLEADQDVEDDFRVGLAAGARWAAEHAKRKQLIGLASFVGESNDPRDVFEGIAMAPWSHIDNVTMAILGISHKKRENMHRDDVREQIEQFWETVSDDMKSAYDADCEESFIGFIDGALEVWSNVD